MFVSHSVVWPLSAATDTHTVSHQLTLSSVRQYSDFSTTSYKMSRELSAALSGSLRQKWTSTASSVIILITIYH